MCISVQDKLGKITIPEKIRTLLEDAGVVRQHQEKLRNAYHRAANRRALKEALKAKKREARGIKLKKGTYPSYHFDAQGNIIEEAVPFHYEVPEKPPMNTWEHKTRKKDFQNKSIQKMKRYGR
jgi:hypothetical protein